MHDNDREAAWAEPHDLKVGDRVEVVEGSELYKLGLRAGVVTATDRTVAEHLTRQAVRLDEPVDNVMPLPAAEDRAWAARCCLPIVAVDRVEPGTDAAMHPVGTEFAIVPMYLMKVEPRDGAADDRQ
jgi:hypothetical protein